MIFGFYKIHYFKNKKFKCGGGIAEIAGNILKMDKENHDGFRDTKALEGIPTQRASEVQRARDRDLRASKPTQSIQSVVEVYPAHRRDTSI
ncbi:hypothetical protein [Helicobacter sp. 13S00477-4]|uniref:hypothetical protein n=1 Tax=Helicobacter sp. 13S00477-4 TaxID=1905759 RepID=UPI0015DA9B09|nr:hypothetical protein [Helicobacter sp. 13S00477-4]